MARVGKDNPDGDGHVVGRLRIDRVEFWEAKWPLCESMRVDDVEGDGILCDEIIREKGNGV